MTFMAPFMPFLWKDCNSIKTMTIIAGYNYLVNENVLQLAFHAEDVPAGPIT